MMADGRFSLLLPLVVAICLARSATGRRAPHSLPGQPRTYRYRDRTASGLYSLDRIIHVYFHINSDDPQVGPTWHQIVVRRDHYGKRRGYSRDCTTRRSSSRAARAVQQRISVSSTCEQHNRHA